MSDESVTPAAVPLLNGVGSYHLKPAAAAPPPLDLEAENDALDRLSVAVCGGKERPLTDLLAEVERLRSLHAAPEGARLRELAKAGAFQRHLIAVGAAPPPGNIDQNDGHVWRLLHDKGFEFCPHPDCVLVRTEASK